MVEDETDPGIVYYNCDDYEDCYTNCIYRIGIMIGSMACRECRSFLGDAGEYLIRCSQYARQKGEE